MASTVWAGLIVATVNVATIALYLWLEPINPFVRGVSWPLLVVLIALALFVPTLISSMARNLQISLASCLMTLVALELVFFLAPSMFPDNVRVLIDSDQLDAKQPIIERLPHSPFAKPRANTLVQIPGYYGPKDSFEYEWLSDRRGFKNLPEVATREEFELVAIGDSFTEGMGVPVEHTWTSLLSRNGHPTYNLGIQGYAPTQFLGAYEHFGRSLSAKWIVVGLLGNVYERERQFLGGKKTADDRSNKEAPQAIGRLLERDELNKKRPLYLQTREGYRVPIMIGMRYRFLTSALVSLAAHQIDFALNFDPKAGIPEPDKDARFAPSGSGLTRYRGEIAAARAELDQSTLVASPTWISTEKVITRVAELARADGAKVLLLFFPNRGTAYYKRSTGRELSPNASDLVQARALREFAQRNGLAMIDFVPVFQSAAAALSDQPTPDQYPYLQIDGHPSRRGHELIASEIVRFLASQ